MLTLGDLHIGQDAIIRVVGGEGELRHHLLDMGLTPGTEVTLRKTAPMGDPIEVELRGYELTLRLADAQKIEIDSVHATDRAAPSEERHKVVAHPGVGELDKAASYHERKAGAPIAAGAPLTFALAGNQNCGKTTLFNQLTGSNQHVGNFPGVTVDRKDGVIRNHKEATVTDLPGIYSLSPYSNEEIVTRDFILSEHPSGIINIVDASNIERNLYLTMQLMELDTPMVLALNMMDEVRANGGTIMVNQLEEMLGIPVVPISAAKNEGIDELIEHAIHVARYRELPGRIDFCTAGSDPADPRGAVHRCIHSVAHLIEDHAAAAGLPLRFYALFTAAFFPRVWRAPVMIFLYLFGILCGILYSLILKQTCFRGEPVPFVMELPNYRLPSPKSVGQLIWEKARDFIQRAFTIIFVATVVIWFLQTFDTRLNVAATPDSSLLALVGSLITPIFKPLGFGDWRISTALITGFTAKESVVSTLTVLLGGDTGALNMLFTPFTALVFLIFTLLYTPCVAAIAAVKRELGGGRAALGVVLMQCGIAWVVAFAVHCVGVLLGLA